MTPTTACVAGTEVMTSGRQVSRGMRAAGVGVAILGVGVAALLTRGVHPPWRVERTASAGRRSDDAGVSEPVPSVVGNGSGRRVPQAGASTIREGISSHSVTAARRLNRAAGTLAFSVLADSAAEHYRGSFNNPAMYIPLAVSSAALAISAHGVADQRSAAHVLRDLVYSAAALTGLIGTGFHIYNITSRPGGVSWNNLFYGAPLGAPSALLLSGLLGFMAERVRSADSRNDPAFLGLPMGRLTAAVTAAGLLGTAGEAGLLHFRGAYHNPFMFIPVTIPPAAALVMIAVAVRKPSRNGAFSRWWLRLTASIGFAGVGFHAYGVHRNMGGWRNWRQNVLNGPPLPAPPSFAGLALAGLAALTLIEERPDA